MDGGGRFAGSLGRQAKSVLNWAGQALRRKPEPVRIRSESDSRFIAMMEQRLPRNLGNPHVIVNVPDYTLSLYNDGKVYWKTNISHYRTMSTQRMS